MTNEELIATIRNEIERRITDNTFGAKLELIDILAWLDTLESEKPINPDDAMKELDEKIALVKQRGTWDGVDVDEYMDEVRGREPEKPMNLEEEVKRYYSDNFEYLSSDQPTLSILTNIARHFAEWQKEQMMKKAIHYVVQDDLDPHGASYNIPFIRIGTTALKPKGIGVGDKVRIIIVKED